VFPAESYAEKDGTVVHPDGRIQRLRRAIAHPGQVRAGWWVVGEVSRRLGHDMGVLSASMVWRQVAAAVPFYGDLTLEEIGGRGVRWPAREQSAAMPPPSPPGPEPDNAGSRRAYAPPRLNGGPVSDATAATGRDTAVSVLRLGRYRPIWAAPEVELSPALHFTIAEQLIELSPEDAGTLGITEGETLEVVARNGALPEDGAARLRATAVIRTGVPVGIAFLADGIRSESANRLTEPLIEVHRP
jgi:NADH-quinone oxidoreductase subunit G